MKSENEDGAISVPLNVTVSVVSDALPVATSLPPVPVEFTQPRVTPIATLLLQGQSGPPFSEPSPKQNSLNGGGMFVGPTARPQGTPLR
jgi:hypothetical protein